MTPFNLDLINWLDGAIAEMQWGTHEFRLDCRVGWTGYQVESLLRRYGIRTYGRLYNSNAPSVDEVGFRVAKHQATWAEYLMFRAKVPITSPTFNPANERYKPQPTKAATVPPGGWGRKPNGIGRIMDWLAVVARLPVAQHDHDLATEQRKRYRGERGVYNGRYRKKPRQLARSPKRQKRA